MTAQKSTIILTHIERRQKEMAGQFLCLNLITKPYYAGCLKVSSVVIHPFPAFKFFASDERIKVVRQMIMAVTQEQRKVALDPLLPHQRSNFEGIFHAMDGFPVTI